MTSEGVKVGCIDVLYALLLCLQAPVLGHSRNISFCAVSHLPSVSSIIILLGSQLLPRKWFSWKVPEALCTQTLSSFIQFSFPSGLFFSGGGGAHSLEGKSHMTATNANNSN